MNQPGDGTLVRSIGIVGLSAIILNGMIGAGLFALPGSVSFYAGWLSPMVLAGVAVALLPVVYAIARLSSYFDETGGPVIYVKAAYGPVAAFQIGWIQCLSTAAAAAANANLLADYVMRLLPDDASAGPLHSVFVLAAIAAMMAINLLAARHSALWISWISAFKLMPLVLLFALALGTPGSDAGLPLATEWSLSQAILLSVYAFVGFEGALTVAGEARDPKRDFPRALMVVFVIVAALYAVITWGYVVTAYVPGTMDKAALATMSANLAGAAGTVLIVIAAALSIFGNVTVNILNTSRRLLALAEIPALPRWFARIEPGSGLPRNAVLFTVAAIAALALSGGFTALAVLSVTSRLLVYLGCVAALPVVEAQHGIRRSPIMMAITALALVIIIALVSQSKWDAWAALAVAVATGLVIQFAVRRAARA